MRDGVGVLFFLSLFCLTLSREIRITEHTELGNNDSVKNPSPVPTRGKARRVKCVQIHRLSLFILDTHLNRCCSE